LQKIVAKVLINLYGIIITTISYIIVEKFITKFSIKMVEKMGKIIDILKMGKYNKIIVFLVFI